MITRIGETYIPPRKKRVRTPCVTMPFLITGGIPSKKNNQIALVDKKEARALLQEMLKESPSLSSAQVNAVINRCHARIRVSNKFRSWHEHWKPLLIEQAAKWAETYRKVGLTFPVREASISIYHYWENNVARDNSNKAESIHDLLVDSGILSGDNWQHLPATRSEADNYHQEILDHITVIHLTAYKW